MALFPQTLLQPRPRGVARADGSRSAPPECPSGRGAAKFEATPSSTGKPRPPCPFAGGGWSRPPKMAREGEQPRHDLAERSPGGEQPASNASSPASE